MSSKTIVFLWLGFTVVLTTLQAALRGNLVTIKEFLMMMASFISRSSLRGYWVGFVRLGWRGWWLRTSVSLGFFILPQITRLGWLLIWGRFVWKRKITRSPTKGRGSTNYLDMPQILLFCTLWFSCLFFSNLIKDWNVQIPYGNNLLSFFFFLYLAFLFLVPCNFCTWRPYGNFCHAHSLFPYLLPRSPFWVFNLVGLFCLNFA